MAYALGSQLTYGPGTPVLSVDAQSAWPLASTLGGYEGAPETPLALLGAVPGAPLTSFLYDQGALSGHSLPSSAAFLGRAPALWWGAGITPGSLDSRVMAAASVRATPRYFTQPAARWASIVRLLSPLKAPCDWRGAPSLLRLPVAHLTTPSSLDLRNLSALSMLPAVAAAPLTLLALPASLSPYSALGAYTWAASTALPTALLEQQPLLFGPDASRPVRVGLGKSLDAAWFNSRRAANGAAALFFTDSLLRLWAVQWSQHTLRFGLPLYKLTGGQLAAKPSSGHPTRASS